MKKYTKIQNVENKEYANKCINQLSKNEWIALEKIHGANFSISMSLNGEYKYYSRTQELEDITKFNNLKAALDRISNKDDNILDKLKMVADKYNQDVIIYGEVFGGYYNGEMNGVPVQKIEYTPYNEVLFFDIYLCNEERYLPWIEFDKVCKIMNIPRVPDITTGTLDELLDNNVLYINAETLLPKMYSNFKRKAKQCSVEGYILRPIYEDIIFGTNRTILKYKNPNFRECKVEYKVDIGDLEPLNYVTINRYNSVRSKMFSGDHKLSKEDVINIIKEMVDDTMEDILTDYELNEDQVSAVTKVVKSNMFKLVHKFENERINIG